MRVDGSRVVHGSLADDCVVCDQEYGVRGERAAVVRPVLVRCFVSMQWY